MALNANKRKKQSSGPPSVISKKKRGKKEWQGKKDEKANNSPRKNILIVPDTNVVLTKNGLCSFGEHPVKLFSVIQDEMDTLKNVANFRKKPSRFGKNPEDVAFAERQASRYIDWLISQNPADNLSQGIPIIPREGKAKLQNRKKLGKLYIELPLKSNEEVTKQERIWKEYREYLSKERPDDIILVRILAEIEIQKEKGVLGKEVIFVTRDRNFCRKALFFGVKAEMFREKIPSKESLASKGILYFPLSFLQKQDFPEDNFPRPITMQDGMRTFELKGNELKSAVLNDFIIIGSEDIPEEQSQYIVIEKPSPHKVVVRELRDYQFTHKVFFVHALNPEQNCLVNALLNDNIPLVIIEGVAGSGKNYIILACACQMILEGRYKKYIATRELIGAGEDAGFLPGNINAKMSPWLPGVISAKRKLLDIACEYLEELKKKLPDESKLNAKEKKRLRRDGGNSKVSKIKAEATHLGKVLEKIEGHYSIELKILALLRGESCEDVVHLDESQHSTKKQIKMLLTRLEEGGKMIFSGNVAQNDTDFRTNSIARAIEVFSGTGMLALITLPSCERGRVAAHAEKHY